MAYLLVCFVFVFLGGSLIWLFNDGGPVKITVWYPDMS